MIQLQLSAWIHSPGACWIEFGAPTHLRALFPDLASPASHELRDERYHCKPYDGKRGPHRLLKYLHCRTGSV